MARRFTVESVFKGIDNISRPVSRMQNRIGRFTRSATHGLRKVNRVTDTISSGLRKAGLAAVAAGAAMTAAFANIIGVGAQFEKTLVSAAAKFPGMIRRGTDAYKALEDAAREVGSATEFTAAQAAEALNFLAMAGFNAESSISVLPKVVDLATAASLDLGSATDIASDALGAFNLMSKDAAQLGLNLSRVNDVLAKTTTSANTTITDMFEAIKEGAPVSTSAGASIETFSALVGELANSGIKGGRAGTALKNIFIRLQAPTAGASKVLRELNIRTSDASGNMLDVVDIIGQLNRATAKMGTSQRAAALNTLFGAEAIASVNVLLASGEQRLNEYRKTIEGASGASSQMAGVMRDTLQGRLDSLNSAIQGVKISMFSMTSGPLVDAIEKTTEWVRANEALIVQGLGDFLKYIVDNMEDIVKWAGRIAKTIAVYYAFAIAVGVVTKAMALFNVILAMNPIGLVVLAIGAVIAALAVLAMNWDKIWSAIVEASWVLQDVFYKIGGAVEDAFRAAGKWIIGFFDSIVQTAADVVKKIIGFFAPVTKLFNSIGTTLGITSESDDQAQENPAPAVVSPSERVARQIEERRTTSTSEVTIRDETNRAEVTRGKLAPGVSVVPSGGF